MAKSRKATRVQQEPASPEGAEERSDEAPSGKVGRPDPEVAAKPRRRNFPAQYKLRILEEVDACVSVGEVGQLLRREGLYSSHLTTWRRARRAGALGALAPKKRGRKAKRHDPSEAQIRRLERENKRLSEELRKAHLIIDVQGKVAGLLGFGLNDEKSS